MKKDCNIIIYSPPFHESSGGITVLHKLCDILITLNYNAGFYSEHKNFNVNPLFKSKLFTKQEINLEHDLIIYPEIILGNPLQGKNILRYILNIGHITLNRISTWNDSDDFVYYSERFYDNKREKNILTIIDSKLDKFKNLQLTRTIDSCFTYRKALDHNLQIQIKHPKNSIEIPFGVSDDYLIKLFNTCKNF